jgi:CheY-like chemotaxis protein
VTADRGGKVIMVIDDDRWVRETLQMALEDEGYQVVVASDGEVALEQIEQQQPSLIMLDWMMPRLNGPSFAAALEQRGLRPTIPLLLVTADGNATRKAAQISAEGHMRKPFDLPVLLDTVSRLVS